MRSKWLVPFVLTTGVACGGSQQPVTHANPPAPEETGSGAEAVPEPEPETGEPPAEPAEETAPDPAASETPE